MTTLTPDARLAVLETKVDSLEKTVCDFKDDTKQALDRIEAALTKKLDNHEDRIRQVETATDRLKFFVAVAIALLGGVATVLLIADRLGWL